MNRFFLAIISGLLLPFYLASQPVTPEEELDYILEEFTLPGGRLGNNVNVIVQGPQGFMWFGSHGGLHRYDGYEFVTYRNDPADTVGESTTLSFHYIEGLYWDQFDKLWVSTWGGGLYEFDPMTETFTHFKPDTKDPAKLPSGFVSCTTEDTQGNIWVGTNGALSRLDRATRRFTSYRIEDGLPSNEIRSLFFDEQGTLWIGSGLAFWSPLDGGLSRYDAESDSFVTYNYDEDDESSLWSNAVRGMEEDRHGNFWVGTSWGLQKMDRENGIFDRMQKNPGQPFAPGTGELSSPSVYSILEDQFGKLWVGTMMNHSYPAHLLSFDPETGETQTYPLRMSAWHLTESADGTIWVSGAGISGKVHRLRPKYRPYDLSFGVGMGAFIRDARIDNPDWFIPNALPGMDIALDPSQRTHWEEALAVGVRETGGRYFYYLIEHNVESGNRDYHLLGDLDPSYRNEEEPGNQVGAKGLFIDDEGVIWGSYPSEHVGVYGFNPQTKETVQYLHDPNDPNSITSNFIVSMFMDSRGDIWAATFENGLNRISPKTGEITHFHFESSATPDAPIALAEDWDGHIWVGGDFFGGGTGEYPYLARIHHETNEITKLPIPVAHSFLTVISLSVDNKLKQIAFAIAGNGIGIVTPSEESNVFDFLNNQHGFPINHPAGLVYDNDGVLWVADRERSTFARIEEGNVYLFEEIRGNTSGSGFLGTDGKVYFLNDPNYVVIDPKMIVPEKAPTSTTVRLVNLYLEGEMQRPGGKVLPKPIWSMEDITLEADVSNFAIHFSDFDFQNPTPHFQYRLGPLESQWNTTNNASAANYYNVPPGEYTFQVVSLKQSGTVKYGMLELPIVKLPPWWLTWWAYTLYGLVFIAGIFIVDRVQRKRLLEKERVRTQQKELEQAKEIEKAYKELKTTQSQLIHSEKMASLGELTAGIAHEIQNPLNFVNNFSDVNSELVEELEAEIKNGNYDEAVAIASSIKENEGKIEHHGKRAEEIVKSMLQHSRGSEGKKEPTDINALADEYLRLAYHGMRARDKSFNADFKTELDPDLPKVKVIPQDIGRVILNLINNAFQALSTKAPPDRQAGSATEDGEHKPTVTVSTINLGDKIQISIKDNGPGIPEDIKDKIFQPFFTTKSTGEGTGLGLSLSYDIINKGHGGELKIENSGSEGTTFLIILPA